MSGPDCPRCGKPMEYGSTTNPYPFVCRGCDERFSDNLEPMSKDWRYRRVEKDKNGNIIDGE